MSFVAGWSCPRLLEWMIPSSSTSATTGYEHVPPALGHEKGSPRALSTSKRVDPAIAHLPWPGYHFLPLALGKGKMLDWRSSSWGHLSQHWWRSRSARSLITLALSAQVLPPLVFSDCSATRGTPLCSHVFPQWGLGVQGQSPNNAHRLLAHGSACQKGHKFENGSHQGSD